MTKSERRMYILGALKAVLLIALVYIVGLGGPDCRPDRLVEQIMSVLPGLFLRLRAFPDRMGKELCSKFWRLPENDV